MLVVICPKYLQAGVIPVQHIENLLIVVVSPQLADPVQQAEQDARELKRKVTYCQSNLFCTKRHLEIISGNVLCECVPTVSQILRV